MEFALALLALLCVVALVRSKIGPVFALALAGTTAEAAMASAAASLPVTRLSL